MQVRVLRNASLIALSALATASVFAIPSAKAYQYHEHPFANRSDLANMSQEAGNNACWQEFRNQLARTSARNYRRVPGRMIVERKIESYKDNSALTTQNVSHVWAHLNNRQCIANRRW